jgi:hypothetical protein
LEGASPKDEASPRHGQQYPKLKMATLAQARRETGWTQLWALSGLQKIQ